MHRLKLALAGVAVGTAFVLGVIVFVNGVRGEGRPLVGAFLIVSAGLLLVVGAGALLEGLSSGNRGRALVGWGMALVGSLAPSATTRFLPSLIILLALPAIVALDPQPSKAWSRRHGGGISPSDQMNVQGEAGRSVAGITNAKMPGGIG